MTGLKLVHGNPLSGSGKAEGGEPPDNGNMEARVAKLEQQVEKANERLAGVDLRLVKIEAKLEQIGSSMSTQDGMKAAVAEAKNSIIMWVVSAILLSQVLPSILKKLGL